MRLKAPSELLEMFLQRKHIIETALYISEKQAIERKMKIAELAGLE